MLVLNVHVVSREEQREVPGALCHPLLSSGSGFGMSFFSGFGGESPFESGEELAWLEGERVPYLSPEYYLGWAKACIRAGGVPVHQDGLDKVVSVQGTCL